MIIHVSKSGKEIGAFEIAEIRSKIKSGELSITDLGWHIGLAGI